MTVLSGIILFLCCISLLLSIFCLIRRSQPPKPLQINENIQLQVMSSNISKEQYQTKMKEYETKYTEHTDGTKTMLTFKEHPDNTKALVWIHGFNDYFFHFHVADKLLQNGFNIYAITLRGYPKPGADRRYLFYIDDISKYIEEIDLQIEWILSRKHPDKIILYGHSKGGLISTAYADEGKYKDRLNALVLNAPFFDFYDSSFKEFFLQHIVPLIAKGIPGFVLQYGNDQHISEPDYYQDLLSRYYFDQNRKLTYPKHVFAGLIRAVSKYHKKIQNKEIQIKIPILVQVSKHSSMSCDGPEHKTDCVLDVSEIKKYSQLIGDSVQLIEYENAIHDVFLSEDPVVEKALHDLLQFIHHHTVS